MKSYLTENILPIGVLLIAPKGIEILIDYQRLKHFGLLIAPKGIEMRLSAAFQPPDLLLIAPKGIEISQQPINRLRISSFNRTKRN